MNNYLSHFLSGALLCLVLAFSSCDENGNLKLPQISFDTTSVAIPAEGGSVSVNAEIPIAWSIDPGADWLNVDPLSGEPGTCSISFSAEANKSGASRKCSAAVMASGIDTLYLSVSQAAMPREGVDIKGEVDGWSDGKDMEFDENI